MLSAFSDDTVVFARSSRVNGARKQSSVNRERGARPASVTIRQRVSSEADSGGGAPGGSTG